MTSYQPDLLPDPEDPAGVAAQWEAELTAANGAAYAWPPSGRVAQWGRQWVHTGQLPDDVPDTLRDYATADAALEPRPATPGAVRMRWSPSDPQLVPTKATADAARRAWIDREGGAPTPYPSDPWPAGRVALRWLRALQHGAALVLLERYLAEIHPVTSWHAWKAETARTTLTLPPENADDVVEAIERRADLAAYRLALVPPDGPLTPDAPPPQGMRPDDADAARAEVAGLSSHPGRDWRLSAEQQLTDRLADALRPLTDDEREAVTLKFLGAQEDGTRRPTLGEYLRAAGWTHLADMALYQLRQEVRRERQAEPDPDPELPEISPDPTTTTALPVLIEQTGDRVLWPQGIRSAIGPIHTQAAGALARADEGQLELLGDARPMLERWAGADVEISRRQLAELNTNHWRALWATLHVYSSQADRTLWPEAVRVPWQTLCAAAGIDPRQTTQARRLYQALDELHSRMVHTIVATEHGTSATRTPLVRMIATWHDDARDRKAQRKLQQYERTGTWTGPAPDEVTLKLGGPMRYTVGAMALPADRLTRLADAAQEVRGGNQGLQSMEQLLYWELVRPGVRQGAHKAPDGVPYSYLDRDKWLEEVRGDAFHKARSRGPARYRDRIVAPYLEAVDVLLRAGIVRDWTPDYQARNGPRDRFEVPDPTLPDPALPGPESA